MVHDCDPGIDDAFAIAALVGLGAPPEAVVAVAGNVGAGLAAGNAARLVALLGLDVRVGRGASAGLKHPFPPGAPHVHGDDGLGGGARFLPEAGPIHDKGIALLRGTVLATGPLTDIALALRASAAIDSVVWMGGSVAVGGNVTPAAEFNAWCDPEAVGEVLEAGVPFSMVPLDVTTSMPLTETDLSRIAECGERSDAFVSAGRFLMQAHASGACAYLHDPVAAVAALKPELFRWEERPVACETAGLQKRGTTVVDRRAGAAGHVRVAVAVDARQVHDLILDAVCTALTLT